MKKHLTALALFFFLTLTGLAQIASEYAAQINKAAALHQAGKLDEALAAFLRASEIHPQRGLAYSQIGIIYFQQQKVLQAITMLQKAVALEPNDPIAQNSLGLIYLSQNNLKAALKPLEAAYQLAPELPHLAENLAQLYQELGEEKKSEQIRHAIKTPPPPTAQQLYLRGLVALEKDNYELALELLKAALRLEPQMAEAKIPLAQAYFNLRHEKEAIAVLQEFTTAPGLDAAAYLMLGRLYYRLKRYDESLTAWQQLVALMPDHLEAYETMGFIYQHLKQPDKAVAPLQKATQIAPRSASPYRQLAGVYRDLNQKKESITMLQQLTALAPEDGQSFQILGYLLLADNRLEDGIAALQRALVLLPGNRDIQATLASALKARNERPDLAPLERAVRENPRSAPAHYRLGSAFKLYGKSAEAFAEFRAAYELAPDQFEPMLAYAFALHEQKRLEEVLQVYQKFYANKPDSHEKNFYLGSTYYELEKHAAAIPYLVKVLNKKNDATFSAWLLALSYEATGQMKEAVATLEHLLVYDANNSSAWYELGLLSLRQKQMEQAKRCLDKLQKLNPGLAESLGRKMEGQ